MTVGEMRERLAEYPASLGISFVLSNDNDAGLYAFSGTEELTEGMFAGVPLPDLLVIYVEPDGWEDEEDEG